VLQAVFHLRQEAGSARMGREGVLHASERCLPTAVSVPLMSTVRLTCVLTTSDVCSLQCKQQLDLVRMLWGDYALDATHSSWSGCCAAFATSSCSHPGMMWVAVVCLQVSWEDGLKKTVDWYLANGFNTYWEHGDVEQALKPHPGAAYVQTVVE